MEFYLSIAAAVACSTIAYFFALSRVGKMTRNVERTYLDETQRMLTALPETVLKEMPARLDPELFDERVRSVERGIEDLKWKWQTAEENLQKLAGRAARDKQLAAKATGKSNGTGAARTGGVLERDAFTSDSEYRAYLGSL